MDNDQDGDGFDGNVMHSQQSLSEPYLTEGFDDSGEEGCGQKLLHLLQKMGVENILIVVCVWHCRMSG